MTKQLTAQAWLQQQLSDRDRGDQCWKWPFGCFSNGYARMKFNTRTFKVAWAVLELEGQPKLPGQQVLHSCDNPKCFNPRHLRWGTGSDNMRDMWKKGRHPKSVLRPEDVKRIRADARQHKVIAESYGLATGSVWRIKNGKTWNWIK